MHENRELYKEWKRNKIVEKVFISDFLFISPKHDERKIPIFTTGASFLDISRFHHKIGTPKNDIRIRIRIRQAARSSLKALQWDHVHK